MMDPAFDVYFRARLQDVSEPQPSVLPPPSSRSQRATRGIAADLIDPDSVAAMTRGALERVRYRHGLRGDAQLLLYLAFAELVARPVLAVRGRDVATTTQSAVSELSETIEHDMDLIVHSAAQNNGHDLISAHRIINATSQLWDDLHSSRWGLWE